MDTVISENPLSHYLIITAHPDDESMFFLPFIKSKLSSKEMIHLLCLSVGDFQGLGNVRKKELKACCKELKIEDLEIINDERLKDGPNFLWDSDVIASFIAQKVNQILTSNKDKRNNIQLITFDNYGISGHPNHISTFKGVCRFLERQNELLDLNFANLQIKGWQLESTNIIKKYLGILDLLFVLFQLLLMNIFSKLSSSANQSSSRLIFLHFNLLENFKAMKAHYSQFVWFRYLFVLFSRYSFINTFISINNK